MILKEEIEIRDNETAGELHDRLMDIGKDAVIKTLTLIETGNVTTTLQPSTSDLKTAHKLNRDNCRINWSLPGATIHNLVRGLSPYPAAWCFLHNKEQEWNVKIYETTFTPEVHSLSIGAIASGKKSIRIAVSDGFIEILSLQLPGKKRMSAAELLNGIQLDADAYAS